MKNEVKVDKKPTIFVVIGPSGVGKTSMLCKLKERGHQFDELISYTTRPRRENEIKGVDYKFIDKKVFDDLNEKDLFVFSTRVHGNWYGISRGSIQQNIDRGSTLFCNLNTKAAKKVKNYFGSHVVTLFIAPPSFEELKRRLLSRGDESKQSLQIRLENARYELEEKDDFDFVIVNSEIENAVDQLEKILRHFRE